MLTRSRKRNAVSSSPYPDLSSRLSSLPSPRQSSTPSSPMSSIGFQDLPTEIQQPIMELFDMPSWVTLARLSKDWNVVATPIAWRMYQRSRRSKGRALTETDIRALQKNSHHIEHLCIYQYDLAKVFFGDQDLRAAAGYHRVVCSNLKYLSVSCFFA